MKSIFKVIFWTVVAILSCIMTVMGFNGFFAIEGCRKRYGDDAGTEWAKLYMDGVNYFYSSL